MKSPWINYEEIQQINITRNETLIFTVGQDLTELQTNDSQSLIESETQWDADGLGNPVNETPTDDLNNLKGIPDKALPQNSHEQIIESKETSIFGVLKKIKEIQSKSVKSRPVSRTDSFNKSDSKSETIESTDLKPARHFVLSREHSNLPEPQLGLRVKKTIENNQAPTSSDSLLIVNMPNTLDVVEMIDPKNPTDETIKSGITQLLHVLKTIQTNKTDAPLESPIIQELPVIEEIAEMVPVIESKAEYDTISDEDVHMEVDEAVDSKSIHLEEKNSESKQMSLFRLRSLLKKVPPKQVDKTLESPSNHVVPVHIEIAEIDHMNDLQPELEPHAKQETEDIVKSTQTNEASPCHPADEMREPVHSGEVYSKTIKSPFSTIVTIDDFQYSPIFGEIHKSSFDFLATTDSENVQVDTQFVSTSTYYPEQLSCLLVSSVIHEIIYLTNIPSASKVGKHGSISSESTVNALHSSSKKDETNHAIDAREFIKIRVPVVVGEYTVELCIEEVIQFEEKVLKVKEISKKVVLTDCHFTPTQFSKKLGDGTRKVSCGILSVEGILVQSIKYSTQPKQNKREIQTIEGTQLHEKITLELVIQLLQQQGVQVNYKELEHYKNLHT